MKKLISGLVVLLVIACEQGPSSMSDFGSNFYVFSQKPLHLGDTLNIEFTKNTEKIDSVSLTLNGKRINNHEPIDSAKATLGLNKLRINVYTANQPVGGEVNLQVLNSGKETPVEYETVKEYPHPAELFTEGFFFHNGKIYESAGQKGKSKLVSYALGSTNYIQEKRQDKEDFSEGVALLSGKIYQLTYRQRKVFVYDENSLELIETLELPQIVREGWGMATNGTELIVSDGTQNIFFFDEHFNLKRKIQVAGYISIYTNLNELEFINEKIYANVWQTNYILIINPRSGAVEQYYDLTPLSETSGSDDVLNGVASYKNNILVTGKNWQKIFELSAKP